VTLHASSFNVGLTVFIVYKHTNRANGKAYVGVTPMRVVDDSVSADDLMLNRWKMHVYSANRDSQLAFHRAIRKHGAPVFEHAVLETFETLGDALFAEVKWIAELRTFGTGGYNMTPGGEGVKDMTPETKKRHRIATAEG